MAHAVRCIPQQHHLLQDCLQQENDVAAQIQQARLSDGVPTTCYSTVILLCKDHAAALPARVPTFQRLAVSSRVSMSSMPVLQKNTVTHICEAVVCEAYAVQCQHHPLCHKTEQHASRISAPQLIHMLAMHLSGL